MKEGYCGIVEVKGEDGRVERSFFKEGEIDRYMALTSPFNFCGREMRSEWNSAMGHMSKELLRVYVNFNEFVGDSERRRRAG